MQQTYPLDVLEISHSTLNTYQSCPRKLEFSKFYGYNVYGESLASSGGLAIHEAVGVYLATKSKQKAIFKLLTDYPIHLCTNPLWDWSLESTYAALLSIISFLDSKPELELATIQGKPAIEVPFLINIDHGLADFLRVVYRGYIDFVFFDRIHNNYFVIDLKNSARKIKDFTPVFQYDNQCVPYGLVLQRALDKQINSLQVNYLIQPVSLTPKQPQWLEFEKTKLDIEEWAQDLLMDLNNIKIYYQTQWFPRRSNGCFAYNRQCKFYNLCGARNIHTIKTMLLGMQKPEIRPFNPWITLDLELRGVN